MYKFQVYYEIQFHHIHLELHFVLCLLFSFSISSYIHNFIDSKEFALIASEISFAFHFLCTKNGFKPVLRLILRRYLQPASSLSKQIKIVLKRFLSWFRALSGINVDSDDGLIAGIPISYKHMTSFILFVIMSIFNTNCSGICCLFIRRR